MMLHHDVPTAVALPVHGTSRAVVLKGSVAVQSSKGQVTRRILSARSHLFLLIPLAGLVNIDRLTGNILHSSHLM